MAALLSRPLSVKFSTSSMRRLSHSDVLAELEKTVKRPDIKSIQIKERECVVTVGSTEVKNRLILGQTNIQNQFVTFLDVDSLVTNVTIKDAPYEMSDVTVLSHMAKYGEIISGSMTRGKIRGSNIENGTRYVKILNCVPVLPLKDDVGRFTLRLFADNNRTPCRFCGETSHPYFKCTAKSTETQTGQRATIKCWNCKGPHARKDCERDIICHFCEEEGHMSANCPKQLYGEYADEILEGRKEEENAGNDITIQSEHTADLDDTHSIYSSFSDKEEQRTVPNVISIDSVLDNSWNGDELTSEGDSINVKVTNVGASTKVNMPTEGIEAAATNDSTCVKPTTGDLTDSADSVDQAGGVQRTDNYPQLLGKSKLIIGDSNACRMRVNDGKIKNISKSGAELTDVCSMICEQDSNSVDAVTLHLGTNDLKHDDKHKVVKNASEAIDCVRKKWPDADVAFSSVIPRVGKSKTIRNFNADAKFVNDEILKLCLSSGTFHYIDNDDIFNESGKMAKHLYDPGDPTGIHVNNEGAKKLYDNLLAFLEGGISDEHEMPASRSKRLRSNDSQESPTVAQINKQVKVE